MSKKRKVNDAEYTYERGPGGGRKRTTVKGGKAASRQNSKPNKAFYILMMMTLLIYVFFMPTRVSNGFIKNTDLTVSEYSITNGVIAGQPTLTAHYDADSEEAAELRKILRDSRYRSHNIPRSLTTTGRQITDESKKLIKVETGNGKLVYEVLDTGDVLMNGSLMHMGYFDNKMAQSFVDTMEEFIKSK